VARSGDEGALAVDDRPFVYAPDVAERRSTPSGFLLDTLRRRRVGRLVVSSLTVLLFVGGAGLFAYPLITDLYTDQVLQQRLGDEYARIDVSTPDEWVTTVRETGSPLTRIVIPAIDVSTLVVSGTSPAALRAGAGHYPSTPLPGEAGNVGIAGHRTTYGRPFNRVDELVPGDDIWLLTPVGDHRYVVSDPDPAVGANPWITHPDDWGVVAPTDGAVLTLTSCHPKGSAAERIIVRAELVGSLPAGGYLAERDETTA
jgi:sortase A